MSTILTGVKPTGMPHIGNYLGAIRPAIELSKQDGVESLLFIADYHSLTYMYKPEELKEITNCVAATWLALGLDPSKTIIYRQSDVPEIFELAWILSCSTAKGLMNRAHAYKALVAKNEEAGKKDLDFGVSMGLYSYPVLMAADILLFKADKVPVGADQIQHIEIARDVAQKFNRTYGEVLKLPEFIAKKEALIPGLDGQKMSKSYNNHIPIFEPSKKLRKKIMKIKTDSSAPEDPKNPDESLIFDLYKFFASSDQQAELAERYRSGIGWGDAKQALFEVIDEHLSGPREVYESYMADPEKLDKILLEGADKARTLARKNINEIRKAIGVRPV